MMCYKDMTFCTFYKDCKHASKCFRPLTPEVERRAMASEMPIARYSAQPSCHSDQDPKKKTQ